MEHHEVIWDIREHIAQTLHEHPDLWHMERQSPGFVGDIVSMTFKDLNDNAGINIADHLFCFFGSEVGMLMDFLVDHSDTWFSEVTCHIDELLPEYDRINVDGIVQIDSHTLKFLVTPMYDEDLETLDYGARRW